jgi:hypothetical protein
MLEVAQEFVQSFSWWQLYLFGGVSTYFLCMLIGFKDSTLIEFLVAWPLAGFSFTLSPSIERERVTGIASLTFCSLFAFLIFSDIDRTPEERIAIAEQEFQAEKLAIEEAHKKEIIEAQTQVKLAEIEAKKMKLYKDSSKSKAHSDKLAQLRSDLSSMKARGADYSKLSRPTMSVGATPPPQSPSEPEDEQTKLILSGLWLGACFFLQRLFEKIFEDKGHALLGVCALGFLIAFFTANYFLLGGSVTGGIMGSVGDRG